MLIIGTPSTCTNIGLHHVSGEADFDLVISGPNLGRNSSTAFTLSSGTIGAAIEAALVEGVYWSIIDCSLDTELWHCRLPSSTGLGMRRMSIMPVYYLPNLLTIFFNYGPQRFIY